MEKQELNKQSSIEWLMQQALEWNISTNDGSHYIKFPKNAFTQAKAMHKDEMEHFFKMGMSLVEGRLWKPIDKFEECYEQTFNTKKK